MKCSPSCTPWMLALKGTGSICTSQHRSLSTRFLRSSHVSRGPTVDGKESRAGRKRDQENKFWRTETWLDVTYLLSWGRTGRLPFHYRTRPLSQSYSTSLPPSLLHEYGILNQCRHKDKYSKNHVQVLLQACPPWAGAEPLLCIINPWFYCCKSLCL